MLPSNVSPNHVLVRIGSELSGSMILVAKGTPAERSSVEGRPHSTRPLGGLATAHLPLRFLQ